jgi:uncharacterized DUF497 family protein
MTAGQILEWNERKRLSNLLKHGIDFQDVAEVFTDPTAYEYLSAGEYGEQRCVLVGSMRNRIIAVIYTIRGTRIRIISARVARRKERELWNANRL